MKQNELIKNAFSSLGHSKLRTFLTILGIVIGISSVITLLNLGQGAQKTIETSFSSFGPNIISIVAGKVNVSNPTAIDLSTKFTLKDADALIQKEKYYVNGIATSSSKSLKVQHTNSYSNLSVTGIYGDFWNVRSITVERGRSIEQKDNNSLAKVAVIGPDVVTTLFTDDLDNPIGQKIKINGQNYTVIGITKAKGSTGFINTDDVVYIPLKTLQKYISGEDRILQMTAQAKDPKTIKYAQDEIETILRQERNIRNGQDSDFTIRNSIDALSFINQITSIFTVFLAAIAAISLLVGGIGIMNIMFVTVTERTKEIGLRKSLGATKNDILLQFLTEAVAVTLFGGIIGTALGLIVSYIFASIAGIAFEIYMNSIFLSVGVSIAIGLVFGIYPAARASNLSPIDALRYE